MIKKSNQFLEKKKVKSPLLLNLIKKSDCELKEKSPNKFFFQLCKQVLKGQDSKSSSKWWFLLHKALGINEKASIFTKRKSKWVEKCFHLECERKKSLFGFFDQNDYSMLLKRMLD